MRVGLLSDVHGNLPALEAVLEACSIRTDALWCLGDTVGYGASPNECAALVRERCELVLAGNHDLAATGRVDFSAFSSDAGRAIRWTREVLSADVEGWLAELPSAVDRGPVGLYHGSPRDPIWEYISGPVVAAENFEAYETRLCLFGHTHLPVAFRAVDGEIDGTIGLPGTSARLGPERAMLNPGSVGQPRDGLRDAAYAVLDLDPGSDTNTFEFRRVRYDIDRTQRLMREVGLPARLVERLSYGR